MKKTDIAMIILIATVSVLIAFFITRSIMGSPDSETVKVKTIERIESNIASPDEAIFNENAINPAIKIEIGDGS